MVNMSKFVHTETGKIVMSVLLGFGLATFFRSVCKGKHCYFFHAPPLDEIENKVFKHDDKCYKYTLNPTKCTKDKRIVDFA